MEIDLPTIFFAAAILGFIPAVIAKDKGKSLLLWWIFGTLVWIIALPLAIIMKPEQKVYDQQRLDEGMKKCPFCAEIIRGEAIVCRYCGREVPIQQIDKTIEARDTIREIASVETSSEINREKYKIKLVDVFLVFWFLINGMLLSIGAHIDIKPYFNESVLNILKIIFLAVPIASILWILVSILIHKFKRMPLFILLSSMSIAFLFFPIGSQGYRIFKSGSQIEYKINTIKLNANVRYDGFDLDITNNDKFDWNDVGIVINDSYTYPSILDDRLSIKSGQHISIYAGSFKNINYNKNDFNVYSQKPSNIIIKCIAPGGKPGSYSVKLN